MTYLDVYKKRISHLGTTPQERAFQSGILEFRRFLKYSPNTVRGLIRETTSSLFDGVIQTDKEDENRVSQILLTDLETSLSVGDLVLWGDDHWIIYRSTTSSYQPHQKFYMVRCNYYIKWVDKNGNLQGSWAYLLGSKDSKIKDNFRTWHDVITPQPNKYINIMIPYQSIAINTEIMVLDEVWYLVDYDKNSVPGISYLSFTETELNEQRDDVENGIANADRISEWKIILPQDRIAEPNSIIEVDYIITKNGVEFAGEADMLVEGNLTLLENGTIRVGESGTGTITVSYCGASSSQTITVGTSAQFTPIFIGDEQVRVASENIYRLENAGETEFSISDTSLATITSSGNTCILVANSKNKLGTVELTARYKNKTYKKQIKIVSLWQVI